MFEGVQRVVFVHAHPDDETLATGALIAWLVASGVECRVLTATRGERGELVPGRFPLGLTGAAFVARREEELAGALAELGAGKPLFLGEGIARAEGLPPRRYVDSGMTWVREGLAGPADDSGPDSLTAADPEEAIADLMAGIHALAPDLVITYDNDGGYGHPDHVRLHELTKAACARLGLPLLVTLAPSASEEPATISGSLNPAPATSLEGRHPDGAGQKPAADCGQWLDLRAWLPTVAAALEHHQTQVTVEGRDVIHSGGQREPIQLRIGLRPIASGP